MNSVKNINKTRQIEIEDSPINPNNANNSDVAKNANTSETYIFICILK